MFNARAVATRRGFLLRPPKSSSSAFLTRTPVSAGSCASLGSMYPSTRTRAIARRSTDVRFHPRLQSPAHLTSTRACQLVHLKSPSAYARAARCTPTCPGLNTRTVTVSHGKKKSKSKRPNPKGHREAPLGTPPVAVPDRLPCMASFGDGSVLVACTFTQCPHAPPETVTCPRVHLDRYLFFFRYISL